MTRSCLLIASVTLLGCESASTTASVESPVAEPALAVELARLALTAASIDALAT